MINKRSLFALLGAVVLIVASASYFVLEHTYAIRVPLRTLSGSNFYYVESFLNGNFCFLELQIGSNFELNLSKTMLELASSGMIGTQQFTNQSGEKTQDLLYQIAEVKISDWKFNQAIARRSDDDFSGTNASSESRSYRIGDLGSKILDRTNLLLDIPHSCLFFTNSSYRLRKFKYDIKKWVRIPFEKVKNSIALQVNTDLGIKKLLLLTSMTHVSLRTSELPNQESFKSPYFIMGNYDFGGQELERFDLPNEIPVDGCLGLNFLQQHAIYIDYPNKVLYIKP